MHRPMAMRTTTPPQHLRAIGIPPALLVIDGRQAIEAKRILGHRVGNGLRVEQEGVHGQVVDGVADLVVVDVVGDADLAAEQRGLLLRLGHLGAREEAARRDAVLDEGRVVGAAREFRGDRRAALGLVEVFKVLLDDVRAGGAGQVEGVAVAVVDAEDVVGAGDLWNELVLREWVQDTRAQSLTYHVKVEIGTHLG